jgi:hypothetical protein
VNAAEGEGVVGHHHLMERLSVVVLKMSSKPNTRLPSPLSLWVHIHHIHHIHHDHHQLARHRVA